MTICTARRHESAHESVVAEGPTARRVAPASGRLRAEAPDLADFAERPFRLLLCPGVTLPPHDEHPPAEHEIVPQ